VTIEVLSLGQLVAIDGIGFGLRINCVRVYSRTLGTGQSCRWVPRELERPSEIVVLSRKSTRREGGA
jgi:hypothetical protein